jgi:hypothetical protein
MFSLLLISVFRRMLTVNITLIALLDIGQKICSVFVRQSVTIPEGIDTHFS